LHSAGSLSVAVKDCDMITSKMDITSETIKDVPIEELAKIRQGLPSDHPEAILIDSEIDRRNRIHQHELNLDLLSRTDRRSRRAEVIAIIAVIIGALSMIKDIEGITAGLSRIKEMIIKLLS